MRLGFLPSNVIDFKGVQTGPSCGEAQVDFTVEAQTLPLGMAANRCDHCDSGFGRLSQLIPGTHY